MEIHLVVIAAFEGYARGDRITDPAEVNYVLAGEHAADVVRINPPRSSRAAAQE